jgi:hypothetical protein
MEHKYRSQGKITTFAHKNCIKVRGKVIDNFIDCHHGNMGEDMIAEGK